MHVACTRICSDITVISASPPLPYSTNTRDSSPLHLYLSDVLWILEAVLISTRGDIYCVLCQVIALITWLVLHTWTESDVKLSSDELTRCCSSLTNMSLPTIIATRATMENKNHSDLSLCCHLALFIFINATVHAFLLSQISWYVLYVLFHILWVKWS